MSLSKAFRAEQKRARENRVCYVCGEPITGPLTGKQQRAMHLRHKACKPGIPEGNWDAEDLGNAIDAAERTGEF